MKKILQDLNYNELENLILSLGEKKFRAKQLYDGLMLGKKISDINISKELRVRLLDEYEDEPVKIIKTLTSSDGTEKYLFSLADGNVIEGVFMRYAYGNTQCVSTQVGCRMGCKFCASTLGGLIRDLSAGEILCEVLAVNAVHGGTASKRAVTNVVLMGSGEPLDNYCEVVKFLKNVSAEGGVNISPRNISLSTCGLVPEIYRLADEGLPVNLTISLHSPDDEGRART
ncbi:MAG: radical SAM protein, partial [Clostridia bacterium]|nr:radical SAM protein [Clostridia bacterium]